MCAGKLPAQAIILYPGWQKFCYHESDHGSAADSTGCTTHHPMSFMIM